MEKMNINWLALVVAAILPLVLGFIWYHPKVFGKAWMKASGVTEEKAKAMNPAKTYGWSVLMAFIIGFFIWIMVFTGGPPGMEHGAEPFLTFKHGALHGGVLGVFVVFPVFVVNSLFEQKSFVYMLINAGYWVVTMALMGGVINGWI